MIKYVRKKGEKGLLVIHSHRAPPGETLPFLEEEAIFIFTAASKFTPPRGVINASFVFCWSIE